MARTWGETFFSSDNSSLNDTGFPEDNDDDPPGAPEPIPDWTEAEPLWGPAWEIHIYGFACLFALLAVYGIVNIVLTFYYKTHRPFLTSINILVIVLGISRAVYLTVDPYEIIPNHRIIPVEVNRIIYGLAFPCLTSAFSLVLMAFIRITKLRILQKDSRLHRPVFLFVLISIHFAIVITIEVLITYYLDLKYLIAVCQGIFITWGLFLCISYIYCANKVAVINRRTTLTLSQAGGSRHVTSVKSKKNSLNLAKHFDESISHSTSHSDGPEEIGLDKQKRKRYRPRALARPTSSFRITGIRKVMIITYLATALGFSCCVFEAYAMAGVYGVLNPVNNPDPWPWWAFHTGFRFLEFAMGCTMAYVTNQRTV